MWLLDPLTLKLHFFVSPDVVEEGYVILSHVWDEREDTFQDLLAIHARCAAEGKHPRDLVSEKIKRCCEVAARNGYKWVWIDTCCIDKTSSTELSEAINSMYRYYALSLVCYAYLRDVPTDRALASNEANQFSRSNFSMSKWHRRGWTLQELIAPHTVLFLSSTWDYIGSRAGLASEIEEITEIPTSILRLEQDPSEISVAQRMSWASHRSTTRLEDEAYCLLGLFGVNMPTLYGEGRKAFRRLQEEIIKQTDDTTLYARGQTVTLSYILSSYDALQGQERIFPLFATSPRDFMSSGNVRYAPSIDSKWYTPDPKMKDSSKVSRVELFLS